MRVRLGHLGPIVLDPIETCFNIMPVAAFAIHAVLALCTARSSPALRDLYTYIDRLKLFSGSTHQVFQAFNAFNLKMSAVARAGSVVDAVAVAVIDVALLVVSIALLVGGSYNPFLYFRF